MAYLDRDQASNDDERNKLEMLSDMLRNESFSLMYIS